MKLVHRKYLSSELYVKLDNVSYVRVIMFAIILLLSRILNIIAETANSTYRTYTETNAGYAYNSSGSSYPHDKAVYASSLTFNCEYGRALDALRVDPILGVKSYSGFITVSKRYNSNLFFWFILSERNTTNDPIVVWLMGYPGFSSMYGVFQENGPFRFIESNLTLSEYSWTKEYNMLYIDNPVGIGYSYTENKAGFSTTQDDVATNLYEFMRQFYEIFSDYQKNELYIGAESYAGKYAVSLAHIIHKKNPTSHLKMHLIGLFVGNGFVDPFNMLQYSSFLYQLGFIEYSTYLWMRKLENHIKRAIIMKDWATARRLCQQIHDKLEEVGFEHPYDFTMQKFTLLSDEVSEYLNRATTRKLLHVGEVPFRNHDMVYVYLQDDILQSVKPKVEELLSHYRMLFYCGQYDIFVDSAKTDKFVRKLKWNDNTLFVKQRPFNWYIDNNIVGYVTSVSNLTEVIVRNANHMTAATKPQLIFLLLQLFTRSNSSFTERTLNM